MEYTSSVSIEVAQKNGETVYSDFTVESNGIRYDATSEEKEEEMDEITKKLYEEMLQVYKKWKKKRVR